MRLTTVVLWIAAFAVIALVTKTPWQWGPVVLFGGIAVLMFTAGFLRGDHPDRTAARWLFVIFGLAALGFAFWDYLSPYLETILR